MIRMPFEDIIKKIEEKSQLSKEDILSKIEKKCEQLSGLISKEGAAHIIANELGVKLFQATGRVKIQDILPGMRAIETVGKVRQVYEVREFKTEKREGKVGAFLIGDETGSIRVVLWGGQTDNMANLKEDLIVKLKGTYVKDNQGRTELHLNDKSKLIISPEGETIDEVKEGMASAGASRKKIKDLQENDSNVEVLGTVVQVFDMRFFEVCPECGRRAKPVEDTFECATHGKVTPAYSYVMNAFLDDGSENIRTVFFRQQADQFLGKTNEEVLAFKDDPQGFETAKHELLGQIVKIEGRVTKNQMFERLEFLANNVDPKPDPEQELKKLESGS